MLRGRNNSVISHPSFAEYHQTEVGKSMPMRRALAVLIGVALATFPSAAGATSVRDRLQNCGSVVEGVLNVPEDIPQRLLDKAVCVIVIPSVVKVPFVVGGSYGRGAMTCRRGDHFTGPWGAPTIIALEGGSADSTTRAKIGVCA